MGSGKAGSLLEVCSGVFRKLAGVEVSGDTRGKDTSEPPGTLGRGGSCC